MAESAIKQLRDANLKYKNLLKLAKERIQQQEDELTTLKGEVLQLKEQRSPTENNERGEYRTQQSLGTSAGDTDDAETIDTFGDQVASIVRVCHRIKVENSSPSSEHMTQHEIWALIEFENSYSEQVLSSESSSNPNHRYKKWKKFNTDSQLDDFIRRETGEPIILPPYGLSQEQSLQIQSKAKEDVARVTEDFRRFRVRSELDKKQKETYIRELQNTNVQTTKRRIEGFDIENELEQARTDREQLERLRIEIAEQENQWKESYDMLLAENNVLKSSGSEALLASQWRQRYETCLAEKEALVKRVKEKDEINDELRHNQEADYGTYEMKYRDLKESFRLYRKKAKEIFEAQQHGDAMPSQLLSMADKSTEGSKLSYLRNLMVNYLSSDEVVRSHMEVAIGTVLQFTPEEVAKIEKSKADMNENWF